MISIFTAWLLWMQQPNKPLKLDSFTIERPVNTNWTLIGIKNVSGYNAFEFPKRIDPNRGKLSKRFAKSSDTYTTFALPVSEANRLGLSLGDSVIVRCPETKKTIFKGQLNDYINERFVNSRIDYYVPLSRAKNFFKKNVEVLVKTS